MISTFQVRCEVLAWTDEFADNLGLELRDERLRSADLDAVILDMEATISQFRDLVGSLQA